MTTATAWTELANALRDATGPSRELDARIGDALGLGGNVMAVAVISGGCRADWLPHFTDTLHIGQIIKVIGEKLPGHRHSYDCEPIRNFVGAYVWTDGKSFCHVPRDDHQIALALWEAFCRAVAAT